MPAVSEVTGDGLGAAALADRMNGRVLALKGTPCVNFFAR